MKTIKHSFNGEWNLTFTNPYNNEKTSMMVNVPCNVEPYLVKNGIVEDYMPCDDEYAMARFEAVDDWTYTVFFDADNINSDYTQNIVFEGIDTIADIYLNSEFVMHCENMHIAYRIDVTGKLKEKNNELKVVIRSSELWAREHLHDMFSSSHGDCGSGHGEITYYDSQNYLRKARHQWGWDNSPRLITSGIIRSVYLEEIPPCRFEEVYLYTSNITENKVDLGANWIYKTNEKYLLNHKIRLSVVDKEKIIYTETKPIVFIQGSSKFSIDREDVKLWWPAGFGEPYLYTVRLEMLVDDKVIDTYEEAFGIRTLKLLRTDDVLEDGTGEFVFVINNEKVFIRGTNWKVLDPLASEADKKLKEGKALEEVKNLNCNMIRIWGGGIYEDEFLFDWCDRNGIMVWQDFMFACEVPPTDEWFCRLVEKEAKYIIKKYRNHASLAVWCGDNENDECLSWVNYFSSALPSHSVITRTILKNAVVHYDPYRSYVDSSPLASDKNYMQRGGAPEQFSSSENRKKMTHFQSETHFYPYPLNYSKDLRELKSIFLGETGPIMVNAAAVNQKTFEREKERCKRLWDSDYLPSTIVHQNDGYFTCWRNTGKDLCKRYFNEEFSFDEWKDYVIAINVLCAEMFKDIIEYCRISRWSKSGVLWWSLMDMWPMLFNYSIMDYEFNKKLPYFWIQKSQQEVCLMAVRTEEGGKINLYAANDTLSEHTVEYSVTEYDENLNSKVIATGKVLQEKNSSSLIQRIFENEKPSLWIIKWKTEGKEYTNHAFTKIPSYNVMKKWIKIIGKEGNFENEILELK
ncbi:MAG: hypothetical protein E7404_00885 [Ruminococcaceae bacterium]|nr:hypothetical protein [Oscillospiraceae bacterium]